MMSSAIVLQAVLLSSSLFACTCNVALKEQFGFGFGFDEQTNTNWVSNPSKGKWEIAAGEWGVDLEQERGLKLVEGGRFYAVGREFDGEDISTLTSDLVVQFSAKHEGETSTTCGGQYLKLYPRLTTIATLDGDTPYSIMFGPDRCGRRRIHLIFNNGDENLERAADIRLHLPDELTHLYTLHLMTNKSYAVWVDRTIVSEGSLFDDWDFEKRVIDDPTDSKPSDWVDDAMIPDPTDVKPAGWDDVPKEIDDPEAAIPEDWDDDDDGVWEPLLMPNPDYRGVWSARQIDNPEYKGVWTPRQMDNPDFTSDIANYVIGATAFDVWAVEPGSIFDNIFVGDSLDDAWAFAEQTWQPTHDREADMKSLYHAAEQTSSDAKADAEDAAPSSDAKADAEDAAPSSDAKADAEDSYSSEDAQPSSDANADAEESCTR